jgi:hypothetical protein
MENKKYFSKTWTDPRQEIRPSPIHGNGIFAGSTIRQGEVVEIIGGKLMSESEFQAFQQIAQRYNAVQIAEDLHLVELSEVTQARAGSLNHCCDSNLWLTDEVTLVPRWDIATGEELTVDYALFTSQPGWTLDLPCQCGFSVCRHTITGNDWKIREVQDRYWNHFSPFLTARIIRLRAKA